MVESEMMNNIVDEKNTYKACENRMSQLFLNKEKGSYERGIIILGTK